MTVSAGTLEEDRDRLKRELDGVTQMLGSVLLAVGAPVLVTKEDLHRDLSRDWRINIDDDVEREAFIFSMEPLDV